MRTAEEIIAYVRGRLEATEEITEFTLDETDEAMCEAYKSVLDFALGHKDEH